MVYVCCGGRGPRCTLLPDQLDFARGCRRMHGSVHGRSLAYDPARGFLARRGEPGGGLRCLARPVQWRRPWREPDISCAAPRLATTRKKSPRGIVRKDRADHEQNRAPADDRERNPIDLAVKCNADDAHTAAANVDQTRWTSMRFDMCPRGHTARRSNKNWQNHRGTQAREVRKFA